jgi:hypothetical protein
MTKIAVHTWQSDLWSLFVASLYFDGVDIVMMASVLLA